MSIGKEFCYNTKRIEAIRVEQMSLLCFQSSIWLRFAKKSSEKDASKVVSLVLRKFDFSNYDSIDEGNITGWISFPGLYDFPNSKPAVIDTATVRIVDTFLRKKTLVRLTHLKHQERGWAWRTTRSQSAAQSRQSWTIVLRRHWSGKKPKNIHENGLHFERRVDERKLLGIKLGLLCL